MEIKGGEAPSQFSLFTMAEAKLFLKFLVSFWSCGFKIFYKYKKILNKSREY